jgi:solute carrier family 25 carnitine/acylcarnitine transporter 20/29
MSSDKSYQHFFGGMIGGMFGTFISQPIDTIRIRLQTNQNIITDINNLKTKKPGFQANYILKDLYRGVKTPIIGIGLEKTLVFGSYHNIYNAKLFKNDLNNQVFAGLSAGFLTTLVVSPIEKVKIMYQSNQTNNIMDCFTKIRNESNKGLIKNIYGGWIPTLFREVPGYAIYFVVYDFQKKKLFDNNPRTYQSFFMGGISGATSWAFIYPSDIIKTHKQKNGEYSYSQIISNIKKQYGIRGFYKGFSFSLMRAVPLHAGVFLGYETFMKLF